MTRQLTDDVLDGFITVDKPEGSFLLNIQMSPLLFKRWRNAIWTETDTSQWTIGDVTYDEGLNLMLYIERIS